MELKPRLFFAVAFLVASLGYLALVAFSGDVAASYGGVYYIMFFLPKILPIAVFGLYLAVPYHNSIGELLRWLSAFAMAASLALAITLTAGYLMNVSLPTFLGGWSWTYEAAIEWAVCFAVCLFAVNWKTGSGALAISFACLAVSAGGNLHEMAFGFLNPDMYFSLSYPLFLSTSLLSLLFIAVVLKLEGWKPNIVFWGALGIYIGFTIAYATVFNPNSLTSPHIPGMWLQRLPTIFLLITLPFGLKNRS